MPILLILVLIFVGIPFSIFSYVRIKNSKELDTIIKKMTNDDDYPNKDTKELIIDEKKAQEEIKWKYHNASNQYCFNEGIWSFKCRFFSNEPYKRDYYYYNYCYSYCEIENLFC